MRAKVPRLVITYSNINSAMAMEQAGSGLGRLIPLPAQIDAGCGLAWCAAVEDKSKLIEIMEKNGIGFSEIHVIELYSLFEA